MKELDILLERFIDKEHSALARGAWPDLEALLAEEDDVLWDLLQDPALPQAKPYARLLEAVRDGSA
jgi:succinate dehydrogenase flavin-adding protein (antitoxin of CptAB toxin-antitoxin module)